MIFHRPTLPCWSKSSADAMWSVTHTSTVSCASGLSSEALSASVLLCNCGRCLPVGAVICCRGGLPESVVMICPGCLTPTYRTRRKRFLLQ